MKIVLLNVKVVVKTAPFFLFIFIRTESNLPNIYIVKKQAAIIKTFLREERRTSGVKLFSMVVIARAGAAILITVTEKTLLVLSGHLFFFVK